MNETLKEIHIITAQSRASNPNIIITRYFLELAKFPEDSPITIEIHDGQIVMTYISKVTH